MKQTGFFIFILLVFSSCMKNDAGNGAPNPGPVITLYKGIDAWTHQPTFIYSDTTIMIPKSFFCRVQFSAAATLRHVVVKQGATLLYEKELENSDYYNHEYQFTINPDKTSGTYKYSFEALDWDGKAAQKTLTVIFP